MTLVLDKQRRRWVRRVARRVHPPAYILGRVACLGQDVFGTMGAPIRPRRHALLNMQKVRCDVINERVAQGAGFARTRAREAVRFLSRADVTWLIQQQERMIWFEHRGPVTCAVIDTFAELTDQRFRHRRAGWRFSCHYTDLHHTAEFAADFECEGLLALDRIAPEYATFLQWFGARYPGVPLYAIDFSAALDERQVFQERAREIYSALTSLARKHSFLQVLSLPSEQVEKAPGDDFPYHFSRATVTRFAALWQACLGAASREGHHGTN